MAAYERVLVEIAQGIGTLTLSRPEKYNAFDGALCREFVEALHLLADSDAVRVIVITGAGRAFCAGADLSALADEGAALVAAGKDVALTIRSAAKPVLAAAWASQPPLAVRRAKEALQLSEQSSLAAMLDLEIAQQQELFATPEARERIAASRAQRSH